MKRILNIIPIMFTLIFLGVGLYMPHLTSLVLDYQLKQEITQRENSHISLVLPESSDFFYTLELFDINQSQIELIEGYRMLKSDVINTAIETMVKITNGNMKSTMIVVKDKDINEYTSISPIIYLLPEVTPVLIANKDIPSLSGVFWHCVWSDENGKEILWLDDKTGKMVAFQGKMILPSISENETRYVKIDDEASFDKIASAISEFCQSYYPIDDVMLKLEEENSSFSNYTLTLIRNNNGQIDTHNISLSFRDEMIYFNM